MNEQCGLLLEQAEMQLKVMQRLKWPGEISDRLGQIITVINEAISQLSTDTSAAIGTIYRIEAQTKSLNNSIGRAVPNSAIIKGALKDALRFIGDAIKCSERAAA